MAVRFSVPIGRSVSRFQLVGPFLGSNRYYHRATFSKLTTFSKFLPATSILKIFPYFKLWYFLVAVADIRMIFLIFYMSKQLYITLNTGFNMRDFAYY